MPDLAKLMAGPEKTLTLRMAKISTVQTGTATVLMGGDTTAIAEVPYLSSYQPAVNDICWIIQNGTDLIIIGRISADTSLITTYPGVLQATKFISSPSSDADDKFIIKSGVAHIGHRTSTTDGFYLYSSGGHFSFEAPGGSWAMRYGPTEVNVSTERGLKVMGNFEAADHYATNWYRSLTSGIGWYHNVHGGGWMMSDVTWMRCYGDKQIYTNSLVAANVARIGGLAYSDHAEFGHANKFGNTSQFGILHRWDGNLYLNSNSQVQCSINNVMTSRQTPNFFFMGDDMKLEVRKAAQGGSWTNAGIIDHNAGSGTLIAFWSEGQGAAPQFKAWAGDFECRDLNDGGYTVIRASAFNPSRAEFKDNIKAATVALPKTERKQRIKNINTVHYKWKEPVHHCANCEGTGLKINHLGLPEAERHTMAVAALLGQATTEPCPTCKGDPKKPPAAWKKGQDSGWYGFLVDDIALHFPELVGWKEYHPGEEPVAEAIDLMGVIALLWEEVKDLEDRMLIAESKGSK